MKDNGISSDKHHHAQKTLRLYKRGEGKGVSTQVWWRVAYRDGKENEKSG